MSEPSLSAAPRMAWAPIRPSDPDWHPTLYLEQTPSLEQVARPRRPPTGGARAVHPGRRQPPSPPATKSKRWSGTGSSARAARYFARVASAPPLEKRAYVVMAPRDIAGDLGPVLVGSGWKEPEHDGDDTSAIDGVTSPWAYISLAALTGACLHLEDLALARINHLQARRPKLWDVVSPTRDNVEGLERLCRRLVPAGNEITDECGQAVRHRALLLAPEEMDAQGIKHKLVPQLEGEMVVPLPWAYHQSVTRALLDGIAATPTLEDGGFQAWRVDETFQPDTAEIETASEVEEQEDGERMDLEAQKDEYVEMEESGEIQTKAATPTEALEDMITMVGAMTAEAMEKVKARLVAALRDLQVRIAGASMPLRPRLQPPAAQQQQPVPQLPESYPPPSQPHRCSAQARPCDHAPPASIPAAIPTSPMPDAPPIHSVVARPATPTSLPVSSSSPQVLPPFSRVTCLDILDHHIAVWNTYFVQPTDIPTLSALDLQQALLALAAACGVRKKRLQEWLNQGRKLRRIIGEGAEVEEESGWAWLVLFDFTSLVLDKISLESLTDYVVESWRGVVEKEGARFLAEAEGLVRAMLAGRQYGSLTAAVQDMVDC
ncbi:hypothetical protein NKR19_g3432 [Coniochaeta hoffmannii]|uniref:Uncharacterized protein n=1 Tax=Coniochaeta hoffmannii TaxID=91930 RepID=A0AA38VM40_9PEZI|nr:hypothetical protein NKR19_g3432 [Coniochaeta hoffmannii]